ncbi:MAG: hypothetical protein SOZ00_03005 [Tidjanibacter sp.]|nr:hypothetical protein [Tidjanibacter sp.]
MKRFLLFLLLFAVVSTAPIMGQQHGRNNDVIVGKDGVAIEGVIIEEQPEVSYKIRTANGEVYLFYAQDVESISRRVDEPIDVTYGLPSPKSPALALLGSVLIPGLGQFINDDFSLGLRLMGGCLFGGVVMLAGLPFLYDSGAGEMMVLAGLATYFGCSLYSIIEAPLAAARYNRRNGFVFENGTSLRISPDLTLNKNLSNGTDTACGMRLTLTF